MSRHRLASSRARSSTYLLSQLFLSCPKLPSSWASLPSRSFPNNPGILALCSRVFLSCLSYPSLPALPLLLSWSIQSAGLIDCAAFSPSSGLFQKPQNVLSLLSTIKPFPLADLGEVMSSLYAINKVGSKVPTALSSRNMIPPFTAVLGTSEGLPKNHFLERSCVC